MSSSSSRFLMILSPSSPLLLLHRRPTSSLLRLTRQRMQLSFLRQYNVPPPWPLLPTTRNKKHSSLFLPRPSPRLFHAQTASSNFANSSVLTPPNHPWPEFSTLLNNISAAGYSSSPNTSNELTVDASLFLEEFLVVLNACLAFARDKTDLLSLLSRKEIEMLVCNGKPFLFKDGEESARRLMAFLNSSDSNVAVVHKANTFDLMRFLLSYASNAIFSLDRANLYNAELVESSVRHLLSELAKLSGDLPVSNYSEHDQTRQMARSFGPNIEMKRGDWICPGCNFMNFARNVKCLECEEARPKRQLTGGEWECPQCDFFNYGRNTVCLRCDCKRPGQISLGNAYLTPGLAYSNETSPNKADLDRRLASNEEKAQRWFSKVSQLEGTDMSSAIADEDFPEIMPLRRGVNRFVVSTRKSPLERRLADAQYRRNVENDGSSERNNFQTGEGNKTLDAKVSRSLDEVLGRSSSTSGSNDGSINTGVESSPECTKMQDGHPRGTKSNYVPFLPLPADMFAKKPENLEVQDRLKAVSNDHNTVVSNTVGQMETVSGDKDMQESLQSRQHSEKESMDREVELAEKSERWFNKVAELHNVTDVATAIPEIMPMRKGENKFVVSSNKDRSLTSPTYKRRFAAEQAGNANYVPFVPFPPDYFAKKDKQQANGTGCSAKVAGEPSTSLTPGVSVSDDMKPMQSWSSKPSGGNRSETRSDTAYSNPNSINPQTSDNDSGKQVTDSPPQSGNQSGKSLEGSAVKEPDPLDMSEEAKAERWFRRVAQIKDISELSQIPDEDFPSIMPMRKGVNRFVVSKRKTPLERRLTSQQYRRNIPDTIKEETDGI